MGRSRLIGRMMAMALAALLVAACGGQSGGSSSGSSDLKIVVSLPVFVSLTQAVAGEHASVRSIVAPGSDPHTYQPKPSDAKAVADAKVILINGFGLEEWLDDLIKSAGGQKAPVYDLAHGLTPIDAAGEGSAGAVSTPETSAGAGEGEDDHAHEEGNPHFWLNPEHAIHYVRAIAQALSEQDAANAASYEANAARYIQQIRDFDAWAKGEIEQIPPERRKIVTFHDAYPYFGQHLGLEIVGVVVISPGREPSSRELADLVDAIKREQVPAIFSEPQFNPKLVETLAKEAGVAHYPLYSDSPAQGDGYLEMMRKNVDNVVRGLR